MKSDIYSFFRGCVPIFIFFDHMNRTMSYSNNYNNFNFSHAHGSNWQKSHNSYHSPWRRANSRYNEEKWRNYRNPTNYQTYGTRNEPYNGRNHKRVPKKFYCKFCQESFVSFFKRKNHENKEHKPTGCPFCSETFRVKHELYIHKLRCTENPAANEPPPPVNPPPKAPTPPPQPPAPADIAEPQNEKSQEPVVKQELTEEVKNNDPERENINCSYCIKTFPSQDALKKHILRIHTGGSTNSIVTAQNLVSSPASASGPFRCPYCAKRFLIRRQLYFHMKGVHTAVFYCHVCTAEFKSKKKMNRHVYNEHVSKEQ